MLASYWLLTGYLQVAANHCLFLFLLLLQVLCAHYYYDYYYFFSRRSASVRPFRRPFSCSSNTSSVVRPFVRLLLMWRTHSISSSNNRQATTNNKQQQPDCGKQRVQSTRASTLHISHSTLQHLPRPTPPISVSASATKVRNLLSFHTFVCLSVCSSHVAT